jgi:hypothetical protein
MTRDSLSVSGASPSDFDEILSLLATVNLPHDGVRTSCILPSHA